MSERKCLLDGGPSCERRHRQPEFKLVTGFWVECARVFIMEDCNYNTAHSVWVFDEYKFPHAGLVSVRGHDPLLLAGPNAEISGVCFAGPKAASSRPANAPGQQDEDRVHQDADPEGQPDQRAEL